jgi:hypothetical protein
MITIGGKVFDCAVAISLGSVPEDEEPGNIE